MEKAVMKQSCRQVHAACGRAAPKHQSQTRPHKHTAISCRCQQIPVIHRKSCRNVKHHRKQKGSQYGFSQKLPSLRVPRQKKQRHIQGCIHQPQGNSGAAQPAGYIIQNHPQTGNSPCHQLHRFQKILNAYSQQSRSCQKHTICRIFLFLHILFAAFFPRLSLFLFSQDCQRKFRQTHHTPPSGGLCDKAVEPFQT